MDSTEFIEWLAFETLEDPETFEKYKQLVAIEDTKTSTLDEISNNLHFIFANLSATNASNK